jgi:hypothetical protein
MRRRADVEIVAEERTHEVTVEANVLAVDDVLVERARQRLDVSAEQFQRGRVIEP